MTQKGMHQVPVLTCNISSSSIAAQTFSLLRRLLSRTASSVVLLHFFLVIMKLVKVHTHCCSYFFLSQCKNKQNDATHLFSLYIFNFIFYANLLILMMQAYSSLCCIMQNDLFYIVGNLMLVLMTLLHPPNFKLFQLPFLFQHNFFIQIKNYMSLDFS